MLSENNITIN